MRVTVASRTCHGFGFSGLAQKLYLDALDGEQVHTAATLCSGYTSQRSPFHERRMGVRRAQRRTLSGVSKPRRAWIIPMPAPSRRTPLLIASG